MARTARLALEVDSRSGRRNAQALNQDLRGLKATAINTVNDLRRLGRGAEDMGRSGQRGARGMSDLRRETDRASQGFLRARVSASGLSSSLVALRNAAIVVAGIQLGRYFLEVTDRAKKLEGQLRTAIPATMSLASAQGEVNRIARETRTSINDIGELYGKVARTATEMGKSAESAGRATETVAKALQVSGAGAQETASTIRQLSQALASGVLRGDEFNSIMENSPRLAKLLADSLDVPIGALRKMAEEGELSADKLYTAMTDRKFTEGLDREFAALPVTFESAMTQVSNAAQNAFAGFDSGGQFSQAIVNFVMDATGGMKDIESAAEEMGISVRSTVEGLGGVWDVFRDGGLQTIDVLTDAFAIFGVDVGQMLRDAFNVDPGQGLARALDDLRPSNILRSIANPEGSFSAWMGPRTSGFEEAYNQRQRASESNLRLDQVERNFYKSLPKGMDWRQPGAAEVGLELMRNPAAPRTATGANASSGGRGSATANAEVGRNWTANEVASLLRANGIRVTGTNRDAAGQQAQIDRWLAQEAARPGSGGIRPAAVGTSAHERGKGVDIAGNVPISKIKDVLKRAGVPIGKLLDEGDHKHLEIGGRGGGKTEAEKALEREQKLRERRKEMEADFWAQLKQSADTAGMLPDQLEQANAEAQLRNALNEGNKGTLIEISELQREQIALELQRKRAAEFQGNVDRGRLEQLAEARALQAEYNVLVNSTAETEQENMAAMLAGLRVKEDALSKGLDLTSETVKQAIAEAEARARTNADLAKKNQLIREGNQLGRDLLDRANPAAARQRQYQADFGRLNANTELGQRERSEAFEQLAREYEEDMRDVARDFQNRMLDSVSEVAQGFEDLFGEKVGNIAQALGEIAVLLQPGAQNPRTGGLSSVLGGLEDLAGVFGRTFDGKTGTFFQGLSKTLGTLGTGAAIGGQVNSLAKALGFKKFSNTGSQIGGAIGSLAFGPIGGIIGSIGGGIIGSLFKKTPKPSATVSVTQAGVGAGTSQDGGDLGAARKGGGSILEGLNSIVDALGGRLGNFDVMIGQYKDQWRVRDSSGGWNGQGGLNFKGNSAVGLHDFNDDYEGAVRYAILNAIKDGAIQGVSATIAKILKGATEATFEKDLEDAVLLGSIPKALKALKDPVGAEIDALNDEFKRIDDLLDKHGGTLEEYAQAEELYQLKRAEIIKQGNDSALKAMRDYLFELRGGTGSPLSPQLRYQTTRQELDRLDAIRASGGSVDFADYRSVADAFLSASRDMQGSSLGFFNDMRRVTQSVQDWSEGLAGAPSVVPTYPTVDIAPVVNATNTQTNVVGGLLGDIRDILLNGGGGSVPAVPTAYSGSGYTGAYRYSTFNA